MSFNLSLVRGYVCPEMEKRWLLGKEPIISVRAWRSFRNGDNPVSKSSVSVAWLVMPIHWIRDEHTRALLSEEQGSRIYKSEIIYIFNVLLIILFMIYNVSLLFLMFH